MDTNKKTVHDFTIRLLNGNELDLSTCKGKKILIVNTASECGFTPQYKELQALYEKYHEQVVVIGFPCNDFGKQESGTKDEIASFCERNYGVAFPIAEKISILGANQHPIYKWLTSKKENGVKSSKVMWNFQKYLIDENGHLIDWYASTTSPLSSKITKHLVH